jgi:hypothetical protein
MLRPRCSHQHPDRRRLLCDLPAGHPGDHARTTVNTDAFRPERISWTDDGAAWKEYAR